MRTKINKGSCLLMVKEQKNVWYRYELFWKGNMHPVPMHTMVSWFFSLYFFSTFNTYIHVYTLLYCNGKNQKIKMVLLLLCIMTYMCVAHICMLYCCLLLSTAVYYCLLLSTVPMKVEGTRYHWYIYNLDNSTGRQLESCHPPKIVRRAVITTKGASNIT